MEFEWDEKKNIANLEKHGISFELVKLAFNDDLIAWVDDRKEYSEERYVGFGLIQGRCVNVVYTMRDNRIRIISGRKANEREKRRYAQTVEKLRRDER